MLLIPSQKNRTKNSVLRTINDPRDFYMPLNEYGRATLLPVVEIGQQVKKYQLIATSEGVLRGRLHAPVSGIIRALTEIDGKPVLHLENDFRNIACSASLFDVDNIANTAFVDILCEYGIVGAGGSQFPTHLKYDLQRKKISTIIINGAECEPFLTADFTLMNEKAEELMKAAQIISRLLRPQRMVIAIERHNSILKKKLLKNAALLGLNIEVKLLPDTYPQGGELQLIKSVTGIEIPKGSIPANYGVLVNNVGTLWAIYNALFSGLPAIERVVTVSGNNCRNAGNYLIKVGTPVGHILKETGNVWSSDSFIVTGGGMMGKVAASPLTPANKGMGGLLMIRRGVSTENNCIKCGFCVDVCPQRLMPLEFVRNNSRDDLKALESFYLNDCIECGACAYICPSDVPLMESIFEGKAKLLQKTTL